MSCSIADDSFQRVPATNVLASRSSVGVAWQTDDPSTTPTPPLPTSTAAGPRFRILRPHAQGGLGQVSVALDQELHREVALKEIQERHADNRESRARFLLEAEITGRLEHPGIVPVYGLGLYPDGRPYYAMRFIKGDSLKEAIERFHQADLPGRDRGERTLALRGLLRHFVDVCNAVDYAHSRGVLHRDLKPANIMLGKFGETLVVDWGLAKVVGRDSARSVSEGGPEPTLRPRCASGSAETVQGAAVGTPAFMSPEQAAGQLDCLGPASDVYSLGATLYCLLTGKPPFAGMCLGELVLKVQSGDVPRPRQVKPSVSPALEAVCLKAMALKPEERYTSPRALADDLEHWLADEPVTVHGEPLTTRLRRWARKHPGPVAGLAATVLVGMLGLSVGSVLVGQKNRALANLNTELADTNSQLDTANAALRTTNEKLEQALQRAEDEKQIAQAVRNFLQSDLLRQADATAQADRRWRTGAAFAVVANPTIRELLDRAAGELTPERIERKFPHQPRVQAEILGTVGDTYRGVGEYGQAIAHLERARRQYAAVLGADDPTTLASQNSLAVAYEAAGQLNKAIPLFEETLQAQKTTLGTDHSATLLSQNNLAAAYRAAGQLDKALPLYEQTLQARKARLGADHPDTLLSQNNLALAYRTAGQLDKAIPLYEQTLQARTVKLGANHPYTLTSRSNLALAYQAAGQVEKAIPLLEQTLQARTAMLETDHPDLLNSQNNLAGAYQIAGQLNRAIPLCEQTLQVRKVKLGDDHPDTLTSQNNLAMTYWAAGQLDKAIPLCEQTLQARKAKLGDDHPDTLTSQNNLALAYRTAGQRERARVLFEQTLQARSAKLGKDHPDTLTSQNNLALAYRDAGQLDRAIPLLEQTLQARTALLGPLHPNTMTVAHNLSRTYELAQQFDRMETVLQERLTLLRAKLPADDARVLGIQANLGFSLVLQQKFAAAEPILKECLANREQKEPEAWTTFHTRSLLGVALAGQGKHAEAEPLLLAGYEGLKAREKKIPLTFRNRLREAVDSLVQLYDTWGKPDQAAQWRAVRAKLPAPAK